VLAGPPVALDDLREGRIGRRALHEATDRIMGRITEQLAVLRGEEPPARPEPRDTADTVEPAVG
jgi:1-acyl-sn-glycerol-3-phosphate acyltransferase